MNMCYPQMSRRRGSHFDKVIFRDGWVRDSGGFFPRPALIGLAGFHSV